MAFQSALGILKDCMFRKLYRTEHAYLAGILLSGTRKHIFSLLFLDFPISKCFLKFLDN